MTEYVLKAEPGAYHITGQPVGFLVEGDPTNPKGRVESQPASGRRSSSKVDGAGNFVVRPERPLEVGKKNEPNVVSVLVETLQDRGDVVERVHGAEDEDGEDSLLDINGNKVTVQVVSVPAGQVVWKRLTGDGAVSYTGTLAEAVSILREAFEKKRNKAKGTILGLDACHFGAPDYPALGVRLSKRVRRPGGEFDLLDAWLVGYVPRSTIGFEATARMAHAPTERPSLP